VVEVEVKVPALEVREEGEEAKMERKEHI